MRGGRGAAVASSIEEVVAVAVHTPPLMALQHIWGLYYGAFRLLVAGVARAARLLDSSQLRCANSY